MFLYALAVFGIATCIGFPLSISIPQGTLTMVVSTVGVFLIAAFFGLPVSVMTFFLSVLSLALLTWIASLSAWFWYLPLRS